MPSLICSSAAAVAAVAAALLLLSRSAPPSLPPHLVGHPVRSFPSLLDESTQAALMALAESLGDIATVTAAESRYNITHTHIGEGYEMRPGPDGTCAHPLMLRSADGNACELAGRADVARHYVTTGGVEALREQTADLQSRAQSFTRYLFDPLEHAATARLFADDAFLAAARSVCPANSQELDPFQASVIVQVPGQTVPTHLDGVWFWGASRFHVPQWLLATMAFSGLFRERFIDQVQLVAYFNVPGTAAAIAAAEAAGGAPRGGDFVYWAAGAAAAAGGDPVRLPSTPGSGNAMDGSKTVHAAGVFQPAAAPPALDKSVPNALRYRPAPDDDWVLVTDGAPRVPQLSWRASALRFSVVYRARCFASAGERARFQQQLAAGGAGLLDLDSEILAPLVAEMLLRRGSVGGSVDAAAVNASVAAALAGPRLDLALALMDAFVAYPGPPASAGSSLLSRLLPTLNWCALPKRFPDSVAFARVIDWLCPLRAVA